MLPNVNNINLKQIRFKGLSFMEKSSKDSSDNYVEKIEEKTERKVFFGGFYYDLNDPDQAIKYYKLINKFEGGFRYGKSRKQQR